MHRIRKHGETSNGKRVMKLMAVMASAVLSRGAPIYDASLRIFNVDIMPI